MYACSLIREKQEKYDSATLLLYRLLEMIEQRRLAMYGIDVSRADYLHMQFPKDKFEKMNKLGEKERFETYKTMVNAVKKEVFAKIGNTYLADTISLLEGFIHLTALQDELMLRGGENPITKIKKLRAAVYLRNNSIFAHGLSPVSYEDYLKFKNMVVSIFKQLCDIEKIDFDGYMENMKWINPADSKHYIYGANTWQSFI